MDKIDLNILQILQNDVSEPVATVTDAVGLSVNACWRRIRKLEADGIITRRVALLDAEKLGLPITVFVNVRAEEHSAEWLENFSSLVNSIPEVTEIYRMAGDVDYLLKVQVASIAAYDRVYKTLIRSAKLSDVSSYFAMEELKNTTALPLEQAQA